MMVYGETSATAFLENWLSGKTDIVLVTGRSSYAKCGAKDIIAPYLAGKRIVHLETKGENARSEDIEGFKPSLPAQIDAYIAVGGGTVIDTTKLLRNGFPPEIRAGAPFLAIPTTAGTGAEATRFAVYYDRGKKMSAENAHYLPTHTILIPELADAQTDYQRASTEFDAYAQAVESLWAKGATKESREYAQKALALMANGQQMLGSYWAGRAINISRTTAAHAFSYYMTARYGIPHGHAVYMMFPYICKNNGHPEYIKECHELQSLRDFATSQGLVWEDLVDNLFVNVNPARLKNNPVDVKKESFQ